MSVARFKACIEALRGSPITNAQALSIGNNLYPLTSENPDPNLTNDQKCAIMLAYVHQMLKKLVGSGAAARKSKEQANTNIADILLAVADAEGEV